MPPVTVGAVNVTVACASPAVAVPMVGAAGATPAIANDWLTWAAAEYAPLPDWFALIVHVPGATVVNTPPLVIVQTDAVLELKVTARPELAVAVSVGEVAKFCVPGLLKVIVWAALGVTLFDCAEARLVPAALVAVTVKL